MNNEINNLILNPAELDNQKIQKVMNNLNNKNIDYSDLYFQYSKNEFFAIEDGAVKMLHLTSIMVVESGRCLVTKLHMRIPTK
jgi:hypothetical protein